MARILIVDDEKSLCQMLEIAFRKEGLAVETVSSGKAALAKIESQVYDLIISDIRMPDLQESRSWKEPGKREIREPSFSLPRFQPSRLPSRP
jgi:CheY-like chemotaxis protein